MGHEMRGRGCRLGNTRGGTPTTEQNMELRRHHRHHLMWLMTSLVGLLAVIPTGVVADYETYVVESDCGSGHLNASLSGTGPSSAALLRATVRASYSLAMECRIALTTPGLQSRIVVAVREIGFRTLPDGSCTDYLQISDRPMCSNLFRKDEERHFYSNGDTMEMLYHVSAEGIDNSTLTGHPGFQVVATAYTKGCVKGDPDLFRCANGLCVWSGLRCDTHNNCGDLSDETDCGGPTDSSSTSVLIILGGLILLLLIIMCLATLLCSKNEKVRRFRTRTMSFVRRFSK